MSQKSKKKGCSISEAIKNCHVSTTETTPAGTVLDNNIRPDLFAKWPKLTLRVPAIFLHKPADLSQHIKKLLTIGIKIYQPKLGKNHTKIMCVSFTDYKSLIKYLEKKQLPYHTFGHPSKRKMKVVVRGLPNDIDLTKVKEELSSLSIPVIRVHKMHIPTGMKKPHFLALLVVPHDETGKRVLKIKKILGHSVRLEPPIVKTKQCFRCLKWGHSQRYCHGVLKCVKCAQGHSYKKCLKKPEDPPKCANCGEEHTANYRKCPVCPDSEKYKLNQIFKDSMRKGKMEKPVLVTLGNYEHLYKNVVYKPKTPPSD